MPGEREPPPATVTVEVLWSATARRTAPGTRWGLSPSVPPPVTNTSPRSTPGWQPLPTGYIKLLKKLEAGRLQLNVVVLHFSFNLIMRSDGLYFGLVGSWKTKHKMFFGCLKAISRYCSLISKKNEELYF